MAEPLTPEAEATMRERHHQTDRLVGVVGSLHRGNFCADCRIGSWPCDVVLLGAALDALRASLDPDNADAVAAWASYMYYHEDHDPDNADAHRWCTATAAALLRARREAERP